MEYLVTTSFGGLRMHIFHGEKPQFDLTGLLNMRFSWRLRSKKLKVTCRLFGDGNLDPLTDEIGLR